MRNGELMRIFYNKTVMLFSVYSSKERKIFRSVSVRIDIWLSRHILYRSTVWNRISTEEKQKLRLHKRDDGEFWMSLDDFINNFTEVQICHQKLIGFANEFSVRLQSCFSNLLNPRITLYVRMKHLHGKKVCFMVHGYLVQQPVVVVTDVQVLFSNIHK